MIDEVMMLRHGRTQYNLEHRLQGQIDVPLDIVGQWQVDQTGFALASRYYWAKVNRLAEHPEAIAQPGPDAAERTDTRQFEEAPAAGRRMVVMTSDLFRAQQTAHAFADILGLPVTCDQRLRERSFGEWEGMTRAEIKANLLELDPDGMNALGGMRNACWCRLKVRHSVNGTPIEQPLWELEEYNKAPAIADSADWENGPTDLRGPHMPSWQPIVW